MWDKDSTFTRQGEQISCWRIFETTPKSQSPLYYSTIDPHIIFCTLLINQAWTNIYLAFNNPVIIKMLLINCFVNNTCRVIDKRSGAFNACYKVVKSTAPPFLWHFKQSSARASDWCRARMLLSHWSMGGSRLWQGSPGQAELKVANTGHRQPGSPAPRCHESSESSEPRDVMIIVREAQL